MENLRLFSKLSLVFGYFFYEVRYLPMGIFFYLKSKLFKRTNIIEIKIEELFQRKLGNKLFILGSGSSLGSMPEEIFKEIKKNSAMSLNFSITQNFLPTNFHVFREIGLANEQDEYADYQLLNELAKLMTDNRSYENAVFFIQDGIKAWATNKFLSTIQFQKPIQIFRYKNSILPNKILLGKGFNSVTHFASTISDCINLGVLLGYKEIILCGVDLNDRLYFWQKYPEKCIKISALESSKNDYSDAEHTIEKAKKTPHRSAERLIKFVHENYNVLLKKGITLSIENPKSPLAEIIPVYKSENKK